MSGRCVLPKFRKTNKRAGAKILGGENAPAFLCLLVTLPTMKAIVASQRGGPEVLELRDQPEPSADPAKHEVVIRVEAAGVNFADTVQTQGMYPGGPRPPYIPGLEFAGRIVGDADDSLYMGFVMSGAYAERLAVNRHALLKVPAGWSATE